MNNTGSSLTSSANTSQHNSNQSGFSSSASPFASSPNVTHSTGSTNTSTLIASSPTGGSSGSNVHLISRSTATSLPSSLSAGNTYLLLPNEAIVLTANDSKRFAYVSIQSPCFAFTIYNSATKKVCVVYMHPEILKNNLSGQLDDILKEIAPEKDQYADCVIRLFTSDKTAPEVFNSIESYFKTTKGVSNCKSLCEKGSIQFDIKDGKLSADKVSLPLNKLQIIRPGYSSTTDAHADQGLSWLTKSAPSVAIVDTADATEPNDDNTLYIIMSEACTFSKNDSVHMGYTTECGSCTGIVIHNRITSQTVMAHFHVLQVLPDSVDKNISELLEKVATPDQYDQCDVHLVSEGDKCDMKPEIIKCLNKQKVLNVSTHREQSFLFDARSGKISLNPKNITLPKQKNAALSRVKTLYANKSKVVPHSDTTKRISWITHSQSTQSNTSTSLTQSSAVASTEVIAPKASKPNYTETNIRYILSSEAYYFQAGDSVHIGMTRRCETCVGMGIYNPANKKAVIVHFDSLQYFDEETLRQNLVEVLGKVAEPDQYNQCVVHLVSNAFDFNSNYDSEIVDFRRTLANHFPKLKPQFHAGSHEIALDANTGIFDFTQINPLLIIPLRSAKEIKNADRTALVASLTSKNASKLLPKLSVIQWLNKDTSSTASPTSAKPETARSTTTSVTNPPAIAQNKAVTMTDENTHLLLPGEAITYSAIDAKHIGYISTNPDTIAVLVYNTRTKKATIAHFSASQTSDNLQKHLDAILKQSETPNRNQFPRHDLEKVLGISNNPLADCRIRLVSKSRNLIDPVSTYLKTKIGSEHIKIFPNSTVLQFDLRHIKLSTESTPLALSELQKIRPEYPKATDNLIQEPTIGLNWLAINTDDSHPEANDNNTCSLLTGDAFAFSGKDQIHMAYTHSCTTCIGFSAYNPITQQAVFSHLQANQFEAPNDIRNLTELLSKIATPDQYAFCCVNVFSLNREYVLAPFIKTLEKEFKGIKATVHIYDRLLLDARSGKVYFETPKISISKEREEASKNKYRINVDTSNWSQLDWVTYKTSVDASTASESKASATTSTVSTPTPKTDTALNTESSTPIAAKPVLVATSTLSSENTYLLRSHEGTAFTSTDTKQFAYIDIQPNHIVCTIYNSKTHEALVANIDPARFKVSTEMCMNSLLSEVALPDEYQDCTIHLFHRNNAPQGTQSAMNTIHKYFKSKKITDCTIIKDAQAIQFDIKTGKTISTNPPLALEKLQSICSDYSTPQVSSKMQVVSMINNIHSKITESNTQFVFMGKGLAFSGHDPFHMAFTMGCGPCVGCVIYDPSTSNSALIHLTVAQMQPRYLSSNINALFKKVSSDVKQYPNFKVYVFSLDQAQKLSSVSECIKTQFPGTNPTVYHTDDMFIDAQSGKVISGKFDPTMTKIVGNIMDSYNPESDTQRNSKTIGWITLPQQKPLPTPSIPHTSPASITSAPNSAATSGSNTTTAPISAVSTTSKPSAVSAAPAAPVLSSKNAFLILPNEAILLAATDGEKRFACASIQEDNFAFTIYNSRTKKVCVVHTNSTLLNTNLNQTLARALEKVATTEQYKDCTIRLFTPKATIPEILTSCLNYFQFTSGIKDTKIITEKREIQFDIKASKLTAGNIARTIKELQDIRPTPTANLASQKLQWIGVQHPSLPITTLENTTIVMQKQAVVFSPTDARHIAFTFGVSSCVAIAIHNPVSGKSVLAHLDAEQIHDFSNLLSDQLFIDNFRDLLKEIAKHEEYHQCLVRLESSNLPLSLEDEKRIKKFGDRAGPSILYAARIIEEHFKGIKPTIYRVEDPIHSSILLDAKTGLASLEPQYHLGNEIADKFKHHKKLLKTTYLNQTKPVWIA